MRNFLFIQIFAGYFRNVTENELSRELRMHKSAMKTLHNISTRTFSIRRIECESYSYCGASQPGDGVERVI